MSTDQVTERRINLKVDDDTHARLKIAAAKRRTTLQAMVAGWVQEKLAAAEAANGSRKGGGR